MDTLKFVKRLETEAVSPELIAEIIRKHGEVRFGMIGAYGRYKGKAIPILSRKPIDVEHLEKKDGILRLDSKVNNKLSNAFEADIVDTKIGYMFGKPVTYDYDETEGNNDAIIKELTNFRIRNSVDDADSELAKMAAICGYGARLCYVDTDGKARIKNLDPFNVVLLGEDLHTPKYALYYFENHDGKFYAEFYDSQKYSVYEGQLSSLEFVGENLHLFDYVPLFGVPNNKEMQSDVEKVLTLIDAYNLAISDQSSEVTQSRLAYLVVRGMVMDKETMVDISKSGVFELLDDTQDVKYLTKSVDGTMINDLLDRLEDNIMRFAKSVNFNDEDFAGNASGVAIRFKLMALEHKCVTFERKFSAALRYQFRVLFSLWRKKISNIHDESYLNVFFTFTRNLPINKLEEAQILTALGASVSTRTALGQSALVDDVDFELEQMDVEAADLVMEDGEV